jgi:hypothetical protein
MIFAFGTFHSGQNTLLITVSSPPSAALLAAAAPANKKRPGNPGRFR